MTVTAIQHGVARMFIARHCICVQCEDAGRIYDLYRRRLEKLGEPIPRYAEINRRHGTTSNYTLGCRCGFCREAVRVYAAERAALRAKSSIPDHVRHGTRNTYVRWCCRCSDCREANRVYNASERNKRYGRTVPDGVEHGNNCYSNWGCRCRVCKDGHSKADRDRRLAARAKAARK
jgi:hypothetical protein